MTAATIAALNDAFREAGPTSDWAMTCAVHAKGESFIIVAGLEVQSFKSFTKDNDPYGEHDFGSFEMAAKSCSGRSITTISP